MSEKKNRVYLNRGMRSAAGALALLCAAVSLMGASGSEQTSELLLGLVLVLFVAKLGGHLAARLGQPEVLGELLFGLIIGNLGTWGFHTFDFVKDSSSLEMLSELGVIILLFQVGLETSVSEMRKVGASAFLSACLGVVAPFGLGWLCSSYFSPGSSVLVHVFVGATLTATSVGITARVLKDLHKVKSPEGNIILGAAVIDDVLGLLVLAVVSGLIAAADAGGELHFLAVVKIVLVACGFLVAAVALGMLVTPVFFTLAATLKSRDVLLASCLALCFALAYLAQKSGLAPIVGAFTAGLILEPVHFKSFAGKEGFRDIDELVAPIASLLLPMFFVRMGAEVDISAVAEPGLVGYIVVLTLAAVLGKQICGLGVLEKGVDRIAVGLGMIPRGEVGLIFAGVGAHLTLNDRPVIDKATFGAIVIMVLLTTLITPPALKARLSR